MIGGDWIDAHDDLAMRGPSGVGESWLACARAQSLTRWLRRPLPVRRKAVCPTDACSWRAICAPAAHHFQLLILNDWRLEPLF
nr:hypothetical protein SFHH103_04811 [Sinorhizobium fredii HH103]